MAEGSLPEDGELRLGPVTLPAGRRVLAEQGSGKPVAWATRQAVPDAGRVWSALSGAHEETGLVPVLLGDDPGEAPEGLFFDSFFYRPSDITGLDHLDAAGVLKDFWSDALPEDDGRWDGPHLAGARAPFSREFPGLAPSQDTRLGPDRLEAALGSLRPARVGLVAASRPADVLPLVGWSGPDWQPTTLPIAAILRSWEARFGARLLKIGSGAEILLLVERPPRGLDAARRVAAEHFAFCDECAGQGLRDILAISASIINAPIWTFWWD